MATLVVRLPPVTTASHVYAVQARGMRRDDGLWEGWLAFFDASGKAWRTGRETVQPNRTALEYWASGLNRVYVHGAFRRAEPALAEVAVADHAGAPPVDATGGDEEELMDVETITAASVADDAGHIFPLRQPLTGRVIAVDADLGRLTLRSGPHVLTVAAEPPLLDHLEVGQTLTVTIDDI